MSGSEYLRSPVAVCKIAEFIFLLSALIIMSLYKSFYNSKDADLLRPDHMERLSFFFISTISLCLVVSLIFIFSLSKVSDRIKRWNFIIVILSILSATLLLLSSALLMNEVTHMMNYPTPLGKVDLCEAMKHAGKHTCGHLKIASVCGFSTMLLFIGDGVLYYFKLSTETGRN